MTKSDVIAVGSVAADALDKLHFEQAVYTVTEQSMLAPQLMKMRLCGPTAAISAPGQFVNIALPGFFLRRPISICDWDEQGLTIIYKIVGEGTRYMAALTSGAQLDVLCGLGNGFDTSCSGERPLLVGGGAGVPPMYGLAKALLQQGRQPIALLGFNRAEEIYLAEDFHALGVETIITTMDGSCGVRGVVTDALPADYSYFYACGPIPMLKALAEAAATEGQLSFEERMGCGFGACMGCTCTTKYGYKRICREGPVLKKEEVIW